MTPQHFHEFEHSYDGRLGAPRLSSSQKLVWDRFTQPTAVLSALLLIVGLIYNYYGSHEALDGAFSSFTSALWDGLVFITPSPLLNTIDGWMNPPLFPRPVTETPFDLHATKSEMMRRVLGLDRAGGVMTSVLQARSRALSATGNAFGFKLDTDRPAGLGNRDNSCYQNSVLQGLAALQSLPEYLSTCLRVVDNEPDGDDVAQTLRTLLFDLNDSINNGKTLWTPNLLKSMSTWTQQDAQEYYSKILDDIDKGLAKAAKASPSQSGLEAEVIKDETNGSQHSDDSGYQSISTLSKASGTKQFRNPLEGLLAQRVACVQCGFSDGLSMIPFNCLTLSLGLDKNQHDLYDRLDAYSKVESIEGVECPKCTLLKAKRLLTLLLSRMKDDKTSNEQLAEPVRRLEAVEAALEEDKYDEATIRDTCKISAQATVSTTKTKQIVIARPPQSLAIHVNRSVFDPATFDMMKNSAHVRFPTMLDLGPWCLGSARSAEPLLAGKRKPLSEEENEEHWELDPKASMIAGDLMPSRLSGPIYELRAAVTHSGRHENGHYICYRRRPRPHQLPSETCAQPRVVPVGSADKAVTDDTMDTNAGKLDSAPIKDEEVEWWRLSDHNVTKVDEETITNLAPGVFMLFYDCVDPSIVLQPEDSAKPGAVTGAATRADEGPAAKVSSQEFESTSAEAAEADDGHAAEAEAPGVEYGVLRRENGGSPTPKGPAASEAVSLPPADDEGVGEAIEEDEGLRPAS